MDVRIIPFDKTYQPGIDLLNKNMQAEFPEQISNAGSKKMMELAEIQGEHYWVALHDDALIGTIGIALLKKGRAVLKRMAVAKEFRGKDKQVADELLRTALGFAAENKVSALFLGTMQQFAAAQKFYLQRGFIKVEKKDVPPDYTFNPVDTVFFKLEMK